MSLTDLTDPGAVRAAMAEFDQLGRDEFLERYGFGTARRYVLRDQDGKFYDSKAIAGVAHAYQFPTAGPLKAAEFSGGDATVRAKLESLGFEVVETGPDVVGGPGESTGRNPPWSRDELILALDCYVRHDGNPPRSSAELDELSSLLNRFQELIGTSRGETLRNVNGVYMKIMNFRRFDPAFIGSGKSGLSRGNKLEEEVWNTFRLDPARLASVAAAIRAQLNGQARETKLGFGPDEDEDFEAPEGRLLTRLHLQRERRGELPKAKKRQMLARFGLLRCEVCAFDFSSTYGERGQGFIECHHTKPVETLGESGRTKLSDLALLCANCHRMIHARRPWISISELRDIMSVKLHPQGQYVAGQL